MAGLAPSLAPRSTRSRRHPKGAKARGAQIGQHVSVIFIADDAAAIATYQSRLQNDGYLVAWARTVEAAALLALDRAPGLVIFDFGPAAPTRMTRLRELKADRRLGKVPLILLGAFDDMDDIREGLEIGARDYLISGETTPSIVARRVRSWLDNQAKPAVNWRLPPPRMAVAVPAAEAPAVVRRPRTADHVRGTLVGLVAVLLKQTLFLVAGRSVGRV